MTTPATVMAQMKTDIEAFVFGANPMFPGGVHVGLRDVPLQSWETPPIAIIQPGEDTMDPDEPDLGNFEVFVTVFVKDTRGNRGKDVALGTTDVRGKAGLETIRQYIRANYNYRAGGNYGACLRLVSFEEPAPVDELDEVPREQPFEDLVDVYAATATFEVIES